MMNTNPSSGTPNPPPTENQPLVITPAVPPVNESIIQGLGPLNVLIGNWGNMNALHSFCMMPLPQNDNAEFGFILKDFTYNEQMTFATIPGTALNRGGAYSQNANTLFYEQRVYFAGSSLAVPPVPPAFVNTLVHAENGAWLFLDTQPQFEGAYPVPPQYEPGTVPPQNLQTCIAKQMSVPHGNSILAVGHPVPLVNPDEPWKMATQPISKIIIEQLNTIPTYNGQPYGKKLFGHSFTDAKGIEANLNINPNYRLVEFLEQNQFTDFISFKVSADASTITNIHFEGKHASVVGYDTILWVLNPNVSSRVLPPNSPGPVLMYSQVITMNMSVLVDGTEAIIPMAHVLVNVLHPV